MLCDSFLIILTTYGEFEQFLEESKSLLPSIFGMKGISEASCVLGVRIIRDRLRKFLGLSRENYMRKILGLFRILPLTLQLKNDVLSLNDAHKLLKKKSYD